MRYVSKAGLFKRDNARGTAVRITLGGLLFLGTLTLLSGCGGSESKSSGPPAPDFTVKTLDGSDFTLSGHRGKVVILYAMAAWCPSCAPEAQALARIYTEYQGSGVEILILDVWQGDTEEQFLQFKNSVKGGDHFWALDKGSRWALAYEIKTLDATVIIDRQGRIAYRDGSPTPYQKLKKEVESLL